MRSSDKKIWCIGGGGLLLFLLWLLATSSPTLPSQQNPVLLYAQPELERLFHTAFAKAKKEISLIVYAITDPAILDLLKKKKQEGVAVQMRTHTPTRGHKLMHRKIAILDDAQVFIGSANLTTPSLRLHDNLVVGLFNPELAHFLKEHESGAFFFSAGEQSAELWLLPDSEKRALERLLHLLNSAKIRIRVAMFTLTHPELIAALIAAAERGARIECAIDFFTARGASAAAIAKLASAGIVIKESRGLQLLHHKWALIDDQVLVQGSANWTRAAFSGNTESFMVLYPLRTQQIAKLDKVWKQIQ